MTSTSSISIKLNHRQLVQQLVEDNPLIIKKISSATNLGFKASENLLVEVIKFLDLIVISGQHLTPSYLVDQGWHELILFTRYYKNFCEQTWADTFVVNKKIAKLFALQIFHLLGYRRKSESGGHLIVKQRMENQNHFDKS